MKLRTGQSLENGFSPGTLHGYFPSNGGPLIYSTEKQSTWTSGETVICPLELHLTSKSLLRWQRAGTFPRSMKSLYTWQRSRNISTSTSGSFDPFDKSILQNQWMLAMVFIALLFAYGGVRLLAWNFRFPSSQERLLWRIAGLYLVGAGVLGTCLFFGEESLMDFIFVSDHFLTKVLRVDFESPTVASPCMICFGGLLAPAALGYLFCRVYIVVESFLSVRHLPIGVYAAVPWANYIPHF